MKVYDAATIRNIAVVGHGGCGKTQLVSTMLFAAGAVNRIGKVDDGTTVTDFDDEEIARKHTLSSSLAFAEWQKNKINIIVSSGAQSSLIVRDDVGDCTQGWQLTPDKEILLCPDTCNQVKSDSNAKVNVLFGCGSLMDPEIR